jgi:hypothetical protein
MFENRVLKRRFRHYIEGKVKESGEKLYEEDLQDTHFSPNIIRVNKSRKTRWVGNVASMGEIINSHAILVQKPEKRAHWKIYV